MALLSFRGGHRLKKHHLKLALGLLVALCVIQAYRYIIHKYFPSKRLHVHNLTRYKMIERKLTKVLRTDQLSGCRLPKFEYTEKRNVSIDEKHTITCPDKDWVICFNHECFLTNRVKTNYKNVRCKYKFILYNGDNDITYSEEYMWLGDNKMILTISDHAYVNCTGVRDKNIHYWSGLVAGFRADITVATSPPGRENTYSVLVLGFHALSRQMFMDRMPKSHEYLTKKLKAVVFQKYNVVGTKKSSAILPMLTGKHKLEFIGMMQNKYQKFANSLPLIFSYLEKDGYDTAYFEDIVPKNNIFNRYFNGFKYQPTKHYLFPFFITEIKENMQKLTKVNVSPFCTGGRPRYKLMLDLTEQFFRQQGKRFCFTFINNVMSGAINMATIDNDLQMLLASLNDAGVFNRTMLILLGDYVARKSDTKHSLRAQIEHRQPMMAIGLPKDMISLNTVLMQMLQDNADILTTPYDVYSTILDVTSLYKYWNEYKVPGAVLLRGLSLLEPIPPTRSCSEAAVEPHLCFCNKWTNVNQDANVFKAAAKFLVQYINALTDAYRTECAYRSLVSVFWVIMDKPVNKVKRNGDNVIYLNYTNLQVKIKVNPGKEELEAPMTYLMRDNMFVIDPTKVTFTQYDEHLPCISDSNLYKFCYCINKNELVK